LTRNTIDVSVAAGAVSSPIWLEYVNEYGGAILIVLGITISIMRIISWFREQG
jgi:hypothetical protein